MKTTHRTLALIVVLANGGPGAGCAHQAGPVGTLRFANQAPVWRVNDRQDVKNLPAVHPFPQKLYFFDAVLYDRIDNLMAIDEPRRAMNENSLGEVPDSTWFTNRIGIRDISVDEMRLGPNQYESPDMTQKLLVIQSKVGGGSAGFVIEDARGDRYIIKFDEPHAPITESATDVAVQRLLWACGYNVPENSIIYFTRDNLQLSSDATVKDTFGNKRRMTELDIDKQLARSYRAPDGTYRALASKFLPGIPVGGYVQEGVRPDDPNDRIPHEHRRDIRGLYILFGWLQQTDAKEDNTLDMWVEGDGGRHYVRHYLVDFGKSFGTSALIVKRPGDGLAENLDFEYIFKSVPAFGLWRRPYEGTLVPGIQGLGMFDAKHFRPEIWKSHAPYRPFDYVDPLDSYWAAKIVMRFTPALIRTAIEQGRFEDPRAVDYLTEVMVARQRKVGRFAFSQVNPLDSFELTLGPAGYRLCFDDLLNRYQLEPGMAAVTGYQARSFDYQGNKLGWQSDGKQSDHRSACVEGFRPASTPSPAGDGYTIVRLDTTRAGKTLPPVEVHLATDPGTGALRIIGIERY